MSKLPDTSDAPSNENATQLTLLMCPERIAVWIPVIVSRMTMSLVLDPAAILLSWYDRVCVCTSNKTVLEHTPH